MDGVFQTTTCANCGRQIRQIRYGDALVWEHLQRHTSWPVMLCTNDRGEPLEPETQARPLENWSVEDLQFLAEIRIKP
jgi:hypothetical protein